MADTIPCMKMFIEMIETRNSELKTKLSDTTLSLEEHQKIQDEIEENVFLQTTLKETIQELSLQ
jgi:hypothetical protein